MKFLKNIFYIIILMQPLTCFGISVVPIIIDTTSGNMTTHQQGYMVFAQQPYVNGGLVFTYPAGLFTTPPVVHSSVFAAPHASSLTYTTEVCINSTTSAKIMVY